MIFNLSKDLIKKLVEPSKHGVVVSNVKKSRSGVKAKVKASSIVLRTKSSTFKRDSMLIEFRYRNMILATLGPIEFTPGDSITIKDLDVYINMEIL